MKRYSFSHQAPNEPNAHSRLSKQHKVQMTYDFALL